MKDSILSLAQPSETVWCVKLIALFSLMKLVPEKLVTYLGTACAPQKPESPHGRKVQPLQSLGSATTQPLPSPPCVLHCGPVPCHCLHRTTVWTAFSPTLRHCRARAKGQEVRPGLSPAAALTTPGRRDAQAQAQAQGGCDRPLLFTSYLPAVHGRDRGCVPTAVAQISTKLSW